LYVGGVSTAFGFAAAAGTLDVFPGGRSLLEAGFMLDLVCRAAPRLIADDEEYPVSQPLGLDFASQGRRGNKCEVGEPVDILSQSITGVKHASGCGA
jgi:hypothetical protein